jgi:hypothetical protein
MSVLIKESNHVLADYLNKLPRKILALHDRENITEFVLHDLCNANCFNFKKAAYFIDNPDFDCLKGIAGFSLQEAYPLSDVWENPEDFTRHMNQAPFNQKVRGYQGSSLRKQGKQDESIVTDLAAQFELPKLFYGWQMKHDNHGLLIYEAHEKVPDDYLINGVCLLSFCPIF